jgi:hypothetical protein
MPTVCWKTRPPKITNLLSIKNSSMLKKSVSENFLVESEWCFFLQNKICPFLAQGICRIPMGTNCAPLLADLFLYSYEVDFIQGLLKKNEKKLARSFNIKFRYIDDLHIQVLLECCYIWMKSSQWENWNHLFCRKVSLLTAPHC